MLNPNSLVLYKQRPARIVKAGDRLEIELESGQTARVRPKDVELLHPGPLNSLKDLRSIPGEVLAAWEILAGEQTALPDLAELAYGAFTPSSAWAAWQLVADGVYFEGTPERIRARTAEEVARRKLERDLAEAHQRAWKAFLERVKRGQWDEADRDFLRDAESLALGRGTHSNVLRELSRTETPDTAHAFLLEIGYWTAAVNPYPVRLGVELRQSDLPVPPVPEEPRRDLTALQAFAIDDEGTDTPDDALSLEETPDGLRLWVHVADVAAVITPGSPLDLDARARGMSLHIPEGTVHLVPRALTEQLGLGLQPVSPALSFGFTLDSDGQVRGVEVTPSQIKVTRLSYEGAEHMMDSEPFATLERLLHGIRERRRKAGAVILDFPEVNINVVEGEVKIRALPPLRSRAMVEEAMILTGIEMARFCTENGIPIAYSQQEPLDNAERPESLSGMFALRKLMKRGRFSGTPGPHGGLGAPAYTQVTSPLRRYLDLAAHQQIRAFLAGKPLLDAPAMLERIAAFEAVVGEIRQTEILSERHWTIVYLLQNPDWRGEGILMDKRGATGIIVLPELALEVRVHLKGDPPLDSLVPLALTGINLPLREASFKVV